MQGVRRLGGLRYKVVGLLLAVALCLSATFAHPVYAATTATDDGFNLTASPLPISLTTTPGKQISSNLRVENSGTKAIKIKVSLLKFKASGVNGQPQLLPRGPGDDFFDWVSLSRTSFTAEPGVWNDVTMTVKPPKDAAFGYYYAVVFSQDSSKVPLTNPATGRLNGATATLVLLDVNAPGEKRQLALASFTATKKLYEYLPASFNITVRNTGNVHVVPSGDIFISRDHVHSMAVLPVNPNQGNNLPDSSRTFSVDWADGFPVFATERVANQVVSGKDGQPIKQLQWDFSKTNKLRVGRYYAHLLLTYNDGTKDIPIDAEVSFWVMPWKLILLIILVPLTPAVIVYYIMRYRTKKLRNKTKYVAGHHNK